MMCCLNMQAGMPKKDRMMQIHNNLALVNGNSSATMSADIGHAGEFDFLLLGSVFSRNQIRCRIVFDLKSLVSQ